MPNTRIPHEPQDDIEIDDLLAKIAQAYLTQAGKDESVTETRGKDAFTVAVKALEEMKALHGIPNAVIDLLPDIIARLDALDIEPVSYFRAHLDELERHHR